MYDKATSYTAPNPINRYHLASYDNLKKNADGSITIYMQTDNPGPDKESNWLPAPLGPSISSCATTRRYPRSRRRCEIQGPSRGRRE